MMIAYRGREGGISGSLSRTREYYPSQFTTAFYSTILTLYTSFGYGYLLDQECTQALKSTMANNY